MEYVIKMIYFSRKDDAMDKNLLAMCGAYCGTCSWKEKMNCAGCIINRGNCFWGECAVAKCCIQKGILHCGLCDDLPCSTLQGFFDDPEHGDNGERLSNLKNWANGEETIIELGTLSK